MPQLDSTAYFSEYLWTVLSFFTFYYFLSKCFLPEFARAQRFEQIKYSGESKESNEKDNALLYHAMHKYNLFFREEFLRDGFDEKTLAPYILEQFKEYYEKDHRLPFDLSFSSEKTKLCRNIFLKMLVIPNELQLLKKDPEALNNVFLDCFEEEE